MEQLLSLFTYPFMQNAILASLLAAIACGIVGTLVVCNRLIFLAGGASHAAYGGIGLALYGKLPILPCTIGFSMLASLLMGSVVLRQEQQNGFKEAAPDAAISVLWAAGMAFGIILIQLSPGYAGELMGFLFGSILAVPSSDLIVMAIFDSLLFAVLAFFHQGLWAVSIDKEFARSRGLPVAPLYLLMVALTAVAVVLLIRVVGLILVLALLTIPPFLARRMCSSLYTTMGMATVFALIFCLVGLGISYQTDLSAGACIVAVATLCYLTALLPMRRALAPAMALLLCFCFMTTVANDATAALPKKSTAAPAKKNAAATSQKAGTKSEKTAVASKAGSSSSIRKNDKSAKYSGKSGKKSTRGRKASYPQVAIPTASGSVPAAEQMEARTAAALAKPSDFTPISSPPISVEFSTASLKRNVSSCVALPGNDDDCSLAEKGITSGFGRRRGHFHKGVDMPAPDGSPIHALEGGVVQFSGRDKAYGICLLIEQTNGLVARYAHMQSTSLQAGDRITSGQLVGAIGRTGRAYGSHLHFELMSGGNLINPAPYIRSGYDMVPDAGKYPSKTTTYAQRSENFMTSRKKGLSASAMREKRPARRELSQAPAQGRPPLTLARYPNFSQSTGGSSSGSTLP